MRCRKCLSVSEVEPIESCGLCRHGSQTVVTPVMVEEEDDVGRGDCC